VDDADVDQSPGGAAIDDQVAGARMFDPEIPVGRQNPRRVLGEHDVRAVREDPSERVRRRIRIGEQDQGIQQLGGYRPSHHTGIDARVDAIDGNHIALVGPQRPAFDAFVLRVRGRPGFPCRTRPRDIQQPVPRPTRNHPRPDKRSDQPNPSHPRTHAGGNQGRRRAMSDNHDGDRQYGDNGIAERFG